MEKSKKLLLEDILARKERAEQKNIDVKTVYVPGLEGSVELQRIPLVRVLAMLDGVRAEVPLESFEFMVELIYNMCPIMRNVQLQNAYDCKEPTDVVCKVLNDNMADLAIIAESALSFYGLDGGLSDYLKNG